VRRQSTMLASAAAAALAALAVTVAVPALGDEGGAPDAGDFAACLRAHGLPDAPSDATALKPWLGQRLNRGDRDARKAMDECAPVDISGPPPPELRELRACLVEHGAQIDGDGPAAIKRWIGEHADDPEARDALKACHVAAPGDKPAIVCKGEDGAPPPGAPEVKPAPTTEAPPRDL
jgi:hypothetical protein